MSSQLTALGRTVRDGDQVVAKLSYGGSGMVTVFRETDGATVGRLFRCGLSSYYDAWTALHPAAPTPSDERLAEALTLPAAVEFLLERAAAPADDEGNPHDELCSHRRVRPADPDCP